MDESFRKKTGKAKKLAHLIFVLGLILTVSITLITSASAAVDFSALTDLINATMQVLGTVITHQGTLISLVVLGGILSLIGIIIYGFIGKLLMKIGNLGGGK